MTLLIKRVMTPLPEMVNLVWKGQALLPSSLTHLLPQPGAKGKLAGRVWDSLVSV